MSTERIFQSVLQIAADRQGHRSRPTHLDLGAGRGELIQRFRARFQTQSTACDYTDELMKLPGEKVDLADLNRQPLPYPDASFDWITATEVVEHLEKYREVLREIARVLKPGGLCILTTPNILNLNSRLRFLWFGYWNLFGPLPVRHQALYSTGGHINPVSWFYLAHAVLDAGLEDVRFAVDKYQRSAVLKLAFWYLPIRLFGALAYRRETHRFHTITPENAPIVQAMNSIPLLLGRTLIVSACKPASPQHS